MKAFGFLNRGLFYERIYIADFTKILPICAEPYTELVMFLIENLIKRLLNVALLYA